MIRPILLEDALCTQSDPDLWFLESPDRIATAKRICDQCPVRGDCLDAALDHESNFGYTYRHGVWGGTTPAERDELARRRRAAA